MGNSAYNREERELVLPHGTLKLPVYFPDATYGYVRSMTGADLVACGIRGLVMNAFHLMRKPGINLIRKMGGLHRFFNWHLPIVTDSGGFQVYSLIRENKKYGSINNQGIVFHPEQGREKLLITPEKIIQVQVKAGADIVICLDDCTHAADSAELNRQSVERTTDWAARCRKEFDKLLERREEADARPLLFAVIQGGGDFALRRVCAEKLLEIGFDGFGFGGYPLDAQGRLLTDILGYVRELVPPEFPLFALGIGHPRNIIECTALGYDLFDCSLPTRDARTGRLFVLDKSGPASGNGSWFSYLYIADKKHYSNPRPVMEDCACAVCSHYSIAFLHYLFKKGDPLFMRLATTHNLQVMDRVIRHAREITT